MFKSFKSLSFGFTLIELLIVIAILGILSTIGVTNFASSRIKARDLAKKSDLQAVAKGLEAYANDHNSYPLTGQLTWGSAFTDPARPTTIYLAKLPGSSSPDSPYLYESADGSTYTLYTYLENAQDPNLVVITPSKTCGTSLCNYKITSTNQ